MLGLLYLKYAHDLSDEAIVQRWMANPYWQHFCGEVFFQTRLPCDPSSLTRYRKHLGEGLGLRSCWRRPSRQPRSLRPFGHGTLIA